ncbi:MAG: hypothetical protein ACYDDA_14870, partial [Acidiferrobacteraceae bacterium]
AVIDQNPRVGTAARVLTANDVGKNDPLLQGNDILAIVLGKKRYRSIYLTITSRGTYVLDALIGRHQIQKWTTTQDLADLIRDHGFHYNHCTVRRGFAVSRSITLRGSPRSIAELSNQDFHALIHETCQFILDLTEKLLPVMTLLATVLSVGDPQLKTMIEEQRRAS